MKRFAIALALLSASAAVAQEPGKDKLQISGIYPHLAMFNQHGECGIGAVVPWAGKLWTITYPPHFTTGSSDKLYEIDPAMNVTIRPESVGGTHACRMIHKESKQLIIGPYFIDEKGNVRVCDLHKLVGRMTAVARHLTDPANKVYFFDMEGAIYEVDVHSLAVTKLFSKPVPGWHGKGGYTSQGRLVIANNGESATGKPPKKYEAEPKAKSPEDAGVLAEWDGKTWQIVERRQFTDVTGPGGINGAPDDKSPLWAIGWDRRSVILKLLDGGQWHTFRLPKASHAYDPKHGWFTEWPRIREAAPGRLMMDMHAMFYDFPATFSAAKTGGIRPIASHLRYIPDFCDWNGRLVLAADDCSIMSNPLAGTSQSNLWFGSMGQLPSFGPRSGWGGPWSEDAVKAGEPSAPFLIAGFARRVVHLTHDADQPVRFTLEIDAAGDGQWKTYREVAVPAHEGAFHIFPADLKAEWIRVATDRDCTATAYFHFAGPRDVTRDDPAPFAGLAKVTEPGPVTAGLIRPAKHNRNLQFVAQPVDADGKLAAPVYYEVDESMTFQKPAEDRSDEVRKIAAVQVDFKVDEASVIMTSRATSTKTNGKKDSTKGIRYRLPKGDARYDKAFAAGWPRGIRECVSERNLMNIHGTFYELPRGNLVPLIRPVCSHGRQIMDFCTWRGLMVLCGTRTGAKPDGNYFAGPDGVGLWFGAIDDLWRLGKPVGHGGPWHETAVAAGKASDPYLMTGFDRKRLELAHDAASAVRFTVEVDVDHRGWQPYQTFAVPPGKPFTHVFPEGYNAHWVRLRADKDCTATATFLYE